MIMGMAALDTNITTLLWRSIRHREQDDGSQLAEAAKTPIDIGFGIRSWTVIKGHCTIMPP
jgi:hypothetical protein